MITVRIRTLIASLASDRTTRTRILQMATIWAVLGAVVGARVGMAGRGAFGALAGALVGVSELPTVGVIFALLGGKPHETILGSIGGFLGGLTVGMIGGQAPVVLLATVGLLVGAIVGSTLQAYVRLVSLPIALLERRGLRDRQLALIPLTHDGRAERPSITA
jgi:hypothetical protein